MLKSALKLRNFLRLAILSNGRRSISERGYLGLPKICQHHQPCILQYFSTETNFSKDFTQSEYTDVVNSFIKLETAIQGIPNSESSNGLQLLGDLSTNPQLTIKQRLKLLDQLWKTLVDNVVLLEERHFMLKLRCYLRCRTKIAPKVFMKEVKEAGLEPSQSLLTLLLAVVAEDGDPGYVSSVVTSMKSRNHTADDQVFASLVIAHAVRGDMSSARQVLDTMRECGVSPGRYTYTSLMRSAALAGDYAALHTWRILAASSEVTLSAEDILAVLETIVRSGKEHLIASLRGSLDGVKTERLINLADWLLFSGLASGGYSVVKLIKEESLTPYCKQYLLNMFSAEIPLHQMISVGSRLVADGTYDRALYDIAHRTMSDAVSYTPRQMLDVLQAIKQASLPLRPHFFWPVFIAAHRLEADQGVYMVLEGMARMEIVPDSETLTDIALPRLTLDSEDGVFKKVQESAGLTVSQLIASYMAHLLKAGHLNQALQLGTRYKESIPDEAIATLPVALAAGYRTSRDHVTTCKLLQILQVRHVGNWLPMVFSTRLWLPASEFLALFRELKALGCEMSSADEQRLARILARTQNFTPGMQAAIRELTTRSADSISPSTSSIPHPSKMSQSELECHLVELESKGLNTRGALRKLLQQYCRVGNITGARQCYKRLLDTGATISPGMVSAMLQVSVQAGQADDAFEFVRRLDEDFPNFQLDCYKLVDLATLLVNSGRLKDAIELINNRPQKRERRNTLEKWERNCWELLAATASRGGVTGVTEMLNVLLVNNYCLPTNVVLGPLIKAHLNTGNVAGAVEAFSICARDHRRTPLQQEVVAAAVKSGEPHLIETVVEAAQAVHGPASTQAVLVAAVAQLGDVERLHEILKDCKLDRDNVQMKSQIQRMSELGQLSALQCLLEAGWQLSALDIQFLIDSILRHYQRAGDVAGALEYWASLENKGVNLTDTQKSALAAMVAATSKT